MGGVGRLLPVDAGEVETVCVREALRVIVAVREREAPWLWVAVGEGVRSVVAAGVGGAEGATVV